MLQQLIPLRIVLRAQKILSAFLMFTGNQRNYHFREAQLQLFKKCEQCPIVSFEMKVIHFVIHSFCLSVCITLYLHVCLSAVCLSVCLSVFLSVCPSICLSFIMSVYLCIDQSLCLLCWFYAFDFSFIFWQCYLLIE